MKTLEKLHCFAAFQFLNLANISPFKHQGENGEILRALSNVAAIFINWRFTSEKKSTNIPELQVRGLMTSSYFNIFDNPS